MEEKKKKMWKNLFLDIKRKLQNETIEDLYKIYKEYKYATDLSKIVYLKEILDSYLKNYQNNDIIKIEILKIIKKIIDNIEINNNYNDYPDYNNNNFINKINNKVEFNSLIIDNLNKIGCDNLNLNHFELSPYQIFLKNFFSNETPYKSLLIYHGTGVGKTCSGISIAENFTNTNTETIILASQNIINNWKNTILNTDRGSYQCTSNKYIDLYNNEIKDKNKSVEKIKKKIINNNYKFYGYIEFANFINKHIENNIINKNNENEVKEIIDKYFNNKLLIIDEVHNIRTEKEKLSRNILVTLHKIVKYSNNLKLITLSATPMYNKSTEIIWLLNLLLLNDNRPEISENEIFNDKISSDDKILSEKSLNIISSKSRGYVSFIRGNDPNTFPYRLYPTINKTTKKFIITTFPEINPFNEIIKEKEKFNYLKNKLYGCKFNNYQSNIYNNFIKENPNNKNIYDNQLEQISIFSYPLINKNLKYSYGANGLNRCFNNNNGIYSYKKEILKNKDYGYFLQLDKIQDFSSKFFLLLNTIKNTKGIIFIFTRYIEGSIIPLMLALEENGYNKYKNKNILDRSNRKIKKLSYDGYTEEECKKLNIEFKQAKYIVISGSDISKNNKEELEALSNPTNKRGEEIKIIIGSEVTKEGIDMKRIREIHILEPWYHLNRIEQVIGRGIRYCSHKELNKNEKNVTIYLYSSYDNLKIESSDIYKYRRAELKSTNIQLIENVLQKNAIDCSIFKNINEIDETKLTDETIETSQLINKKNGTNKYQIIYNYNPYKKQYFNLLCGKYCNYKCNTETKIKTNDISTINKKQIDNIFKLVYKYIAALFKKQLVYKLSKIVDIIQLYITIDKHVLYLCLDKMINEKIMLQNENNINGYLIYKNEYYIFQPNNLTENIPYYYRNKKVQNDEKYINLKIEIKEKKQIKSVKNETKIKIKYDFNKIKKIIIKNYDSILFNFKWLNHIIKMNYTCDKLDFDIKLHLFYFIAINDKDYIKYDNDNIIKNYYSNNFIYKEKKNIL